LAKDVGMLFPIYDARTSTLHRWTFQLNDGLTPNDPRYEFLSGSFQVTLDDPRDLVQPDVPSPYPLTNRIQLKTSCTVFFTDSFVSFFLPPKDADYCPVIFTE